MYRSLEALHDALLDSGGLMVFRWDACGILCVLLAYAAILYADYVVIVWLILPSFDGSLWGVAHAVVFNVLVVFMWLAHTRAMTSDPGIVPLPPPKTDARPPADSDDSDADSAERRSFVGDEWTVCGRCEAPRPPRAHHCRVCKRCVRKMDHHCPWINNCVGEFNQKYFMQFLAYVGVASLYCLGLVVVAWLRCSDDACQFVADVRQTRILHTIFVTVESALFLLFVVAVSCDQLQAVFTDETAVEQVQRRGPYRREKSKWTLLREVCGAGPIVCWALPCHSAPRPDGPRSAETSDYIV